MTHIETRDGTRLFTKVWGEGKPVVLIHGWPLTADTWDSVALALANDGYKAISYDRRGFGRSDQPWNGYNYDTLSDDLADIMKATGATQDATIIGFSMGGGEVARYMTRHAGKGLIKAGLISSIVPYMLKTDDNPNGVKEDVLNEMVKGMKTDRAAFMKDFLKDFYGVKKAKNPVSDAYLQRSWNMCMMAGLRPTLACAEAFAYTDFRDELQAFEVPTLVIHGTADETVPIDATGRPAADGIKHAKFIEYDGAPHGLFATHKEQFIKDIRGFVAQDV
tara:strand:- start:8459 stop:9289 length:831 start_codon:yes stop_codon:yes gene_type:complete